MEDEDEIRSLLRAAEDSASGAPEDFREDLLSHLTSSDGTEALAGARSTPARLNELTARSNQRKRWPVVALGAAAAVLLALIVVIGGSDSSDEDITAASGTPTSDDASQTQTSAAVPLIDACAAFRDVAWEDSSRIELLEGTASPTDDQYERAANALDELAATLETAAIDTEDITRAAALLREAQRLEADSPDTAVARRNAANTALIRASRDIIDGGGPALCFG